VIHIDLADAVKVTHLRWEQSLEPADHPDHCEIRWSINLTFDIQMQQLRAVQLRILAVKSNPLISPEKKQLLDINCRGGAYIIA
jgi:hypothetical protein